VAGVGGLNLDDVELRNRTRVVGDPVQAVVVEGDEHAVTSDMGVGLEVPVPQAHGELKRRERVLRRPTGPAPVGERDRTGVGEKRVHILRCPVRARHPGNL